MSIFLTRIGKVTAVSALYASLTLLAACSSGGDKDKDKDNTPDTSSTLVTDTDSEIDTPVNDSNESGAKDVVGRWVLCNEVGGLRVEYEFTASTYANRVGAGSCAGYDSSDQVIENAGSYSITGTTMSDSGLTAFTMELSTETFNGFAVFASVSETRFRLAYTGTPDELVFSDDSSGEQERSLTLDFDKPYVRY